MYCRLKEVGQKIKKFALELNCLREGCFPVADYRG